MTGIAERAPQQERRRRRGAYAASASALLAAALFYVASARKDEASPPAALASSVEPSSANRVHSQKAELLVRVLSETRPVSGARITLQRNDTASDLLRRGPTEENGVARFSGLLPGEYTIVVESDAFVSHREKLVLVAAPLTLQVVLARTAASAASTTTQPTRRVAGRVVSRTGEPIAGASVGSSDASGTFSTTDDQGSFELQGVGAGPLAIYATAPGYAAKHRRNVAPGTRDLTLELEPSATLRGALEWPAGAELVNVGVCHYDSFFRREICISRRIYRPPANAYEIPSLPSGNYDLVVEAAGRTPQRYPVKMVAGAVVEGPRVAWTLD